MRKIKMCESAAQIQLSLRMEREKQPEPENEVDTNRGIWRQNVGEHEMEGEEKDNSQLPYFTARLTVGGAKGAQLFSLKGSYQGSIRGQEWKS